MGYTFYAKNGTYLSRNLSAGNYLAKITLGLWDKIGCHPKTFADCKLVARILRNRIHLNQYHRDYYEEIYDWEKESEGSIEFLKMLASFLEESGGLMDEGEFYEKYGYGENGCGKDYEKIYKKRGGLKNLNRATKIFGQSDDNIYAEGDYSGQYSDFFHAQDGFILFVSDGTIFKIKYGERGIWKITLIRKGSLFTTITRCHDPEADIYSDLIYFTRGITSIYVIPEADAEVLH